MPKCNRRASQNLSTHLSYKSSRRRTSSNSARGQGGRGCAEATAALCWCLWTCILHFNFMHDTLKGGYRVCLCYQLCLPTAFVYRPLGGRSRFRKSTRGRFLLSRPAAPLIDSDRDERASTYSYRWNNARLLTTRPTTLWNRTKGIGGKEYPTGTHS